MKKTAFIIAAVFAAIFTANADCPAPDNVQVIPIDNPNTGRGIVVVWTSSVQDAVYDIYFERMGYNNNRDSIMGTPHTQSGVLRFSRFYNGLYKITVCVHCPDGSIVCSQPITYIIEDPHTRLPTCPIDFGTPSRSGMKDTTLCGIESVTLKPTVPVINNGLIDHYNVEQILFSPQYSFNIPALYSHNINFTQDDKFADIVQLPFSFCFYENSYNQILLGTNGNISFNVQYSDSTCLYDYQYQDFPNANISNVLKNSIFGVMEDVGEINHIHDRSVCQWAILGSPGCRVFVMNYNEMPLFPCNEIRNSYQTVLYEGINVIDVYVKKRESCTNWFNGRGVIGVMNSNGEKATIAPNRNVTDNWTTVDSNTGVNTPEAWRFTPVSITPNYTVEWYNGITTMPYSRFSTSDSVILNKADGNRTITARVTVYNCLGQALVYRDTIRIFWTEQEFSNVDLTIYDNQFPYTYSDTVFKVGTTSGQYIIHKKSEANCDSVITINLTVMPASRIDEIFAKNIAIFPNPAVDELFIMNNEQLTINNVEITDLTGKIIYNSSFILNNSINVGHLASGVYLIKINTEKGAVIKKFVKK